MTEIIYFRNYMFTLGNCHHESTTIHEHVWYRSKDAYNQKNNENNSYACP